MCKGIYLNSHALLSDSASSQAVTNICVLKRLALMHWSTKLNVHMLIMDATAKVFHVMEDSTCHILVCHGIN